MSAHCRRLLAALIALVLLFPAGSGAVSEPMEDLPAQEAPAAEFSEAEPAQALPEAAESVEESPEEPAEELPEEPAEELQEEPAEELSEEPVGKSPEEPIGESPEEPIGESPEEPIGELSEEPIGESLPAPAAQAYEEAPIRLGESALTVRASVWQRLEVVLSPEYADASVLWTSSDPAVLHVEDGVLRGGKRGKATVTASIEEGAFSASCQVEVLPLGLVVETSSTAVRILGYSTEADVWGEKVVVPDEIYGRPVISVRSYAFAARGRTVKEIVLPKHLRVIEAYTFFGCTALERVEIPEGVRSIGERAFAGNVNLQYADLPSSLEELDYAAFQDCRSLKRAEIPAGLTNVPSAAFQNCKALESVRIAEGVRTIDSRAFGGCISLKGLALPSSLESISWAFEDCKALTEVTIPNAGLDFSNAFSGCKALCKVALPPDLKVIGREAFSGCTALEEIEFPRGLEYIGDGAFAYAGLKHIDLPEGLVSIGNAFAGCPLAEVVVPEGVRALSGTFNNCQNLRTVRLPATLSQIGGDTFAGCTSLEGIELPEALEWIGDRAFRNSGLCAITIPDLVTRIGSETFEYCADLARVELPQGIVRIGSEAFYECTALEEIRLPSGLGRMETKAFAGCTSLRSIAIPAGVYDFQSWLFLDCTSLAEVRLPEGLEKIGNGMFEGCTALQGIDLPSGLQVIGRGAFKGCSALSSIALPQSIEYVGSEAFEGCALTRVEIPAGAAQLDNEAFADCPLTRAVVRGIDTRMGSGPYQFHAYAFDLCPDVHIYCLKGSLAEQYALEQNKRHTAYQAFEHTLTLRDAFGMEQTSVRAVDEALGDIPAPEMEYHSFGGWYRDEKLTKPWNLATDRMPDADLLLYAKWIKNAPGKITAAAAAITIGRGERVQIAYAISPANTLATVAFSSSKKSVATVGAQGEVLGVKAGSATITLKTHNGKKATVKVTVKEAPKAMKLNAAALTLGCGDSFQLKPAFNGKSGGGVRYAIAGDGGSFAAVDAAGRVTALRAGEATIVATSYNGLTSACALRVAPAPEALELSAPSLRIGVGQKVWLVSALLPEGAAATVRYSSGNTKIATVDAGGVVKGIKAGEVVLYATAHNGIVGQVAFSVVKAPTKVGLVAERKTIGIGERVSLRASIPADCAGSWSFSSSKPSVARVDASGEVIGLKAGKATITVKTHNGKKAALTITVKKAPKSLFLNREALVLGEGDRFRLLATLSSGSAAKPLYAVMAGGEGIVEVGGDGTIVARAQGEAVVTVGTYNGLARSCAVRVAAAPEAIALDAPQTRIGVGQKVQLAPALLPEGTAATLTYATGNAGVATVSASGAVLGKKAGAVAITATAHNGASQSIAITVVKAPAKVSVSAPSRSIGVGEAVRLSVAIPADSAASWSFSSSNGAVARVDASGEVTGLKAGKATITVKTHNGKKAAIAISVAK